MKGIAAGMSIVILTTALMLTVSYAAKVRREAEELRKQPLTIRDMVLLDENTLVAQQYAFGQRGEE